MAKRKRNLNSEGRHLEALRLRMLGVTYQNIADTLGYRGHAGARAAVSAELERVQYEAVNDYRTLQLNRLEGLHTTFYPRAASGEVGAAEVTIRIEEKISRLLGLDAPQRFAPTTPDGQSAYSNPYAQCTADELLALARQVVERAAPKPSATA